jgi:Mn2+/Fe2+ NRAMP family transporter
VTVVTAGIATELFGITDVVHWSILLTLICFGILLLGKYHLLDRFIKVIILTLAVSSILAVFIALFKSEQAIPLTQVFPEGAGLLFLIAFMGWMPAPLDISIWHSIWSLEKKKALGEELDLKASLFDFNVGYIATVVLGLCFIGLGALVMFGSGETFSNQGAVFAGQLIDLYTTNLGKGAYGLIAVAAFTTMFSTTITTLDASPRAMSITSQLLFKHQKDQYLHWIIALAVGTSLIFFFLLSEMGLLVQIATVLSFITAPLYALLNYRLVISKHMPQNDRPSKKLRILSVLSLLFLFGFTLGYLISLF